MSKKCTAFWREAHFKVNMFQKHYMFGPLLDVPMSFGLALGIVHLVKSQRKPEGLVAVPKTMAGVEPLARICKDACRVAGAVQDMSIRNVRRLGR